MKLGTTELPKFKRLKKRLKLSTWGAVGILECLWNFTCRSAPAGNIGKHSNEDIALAIDWDEDADELINALVDCGWLDKSDAHRLVVHDWEEHCPTWIKGNNARRSAKKPPESDKPSDPEPQNNSGQPKVDTKYDSKSDTTNPIQFSSNQVNSGQAKPNQDCAADAAVVVEPPPSKPKRQPAKIEPAVVPESLNHPEFLQAWESWLAHRRQLRKPMTTNSQSEQLRQFSEVGIHAAVEQIRHSMAKGWTGIFPPDNQARAGPPPADDPRGNKAAVQEYLARKRGTQNEFWDTGTDEPEG